MLAPINICSVPHPAPVPADGNLGLQRKTAYPDERHGLIENRVLGELCSHEKLFLGLYHAEPLFGSGVQGLQWQCLPWGAPITL